MKPSVSIMWFRRDLRLTDNAALFYALKENEKVIPIFIFDKNILDKLEDKTDKRVQFIFNALQEIQEKLVEIGSSLLTFYSSPKSAFEQILQLYEVKNVYTNHDYEQYGLQRDEEIKTFLQHHHINFKTYKDQVIFEKDEVVKDDGKPYTVFTPYSKKWKLKLAEYFYKSYPTEEYYTNFFKQAAQPLVTLPQMGFETIETDFPKKSLNIELVKKYKEQRDYPAINGTSKLGVHLRFGTVSIRKLVQYALPLSETYLNELIWRDFYFNILHHFPHIRQGKAFRQEYDLIAWRNNEEEFKKWCEGKTGYPIVDAGMRELNTTGYMHNRVRMIVASFLTKHLLIDWRWGEAYFAQKLLDFDFAANNGGWQWAAGSGCDAAPYFRVFNPRLQTEKFDKDLRYIKKWVHELSSFNYPKPIVVHEDARKRCLEEYGKVLKKDKATV
jgi:deoxyribodipyrimidine photo-lyase